MDKYTESILRMSDAERKRMLEGDFTDAAPWPDEMVRLQLALDAAESEVARLRSALERIAAAPYTVDGGSETILDVCLGIAQQTLAEASGAPPPSVVCDLFREWTGAPDVCGNCMRLRSGHRQAGG